VSALLLGKSPPKLESSDAVALPQPTATPTPVTAAIAALPTMIFVSITLHSQVGSPVTPSVTVKYCLPGIITLIQGELSIFVLNVTVLGGEGSN
jgi:hypothetical protein